MNIISKIDVCDLSINFNWNEYINFKDDLSHYKIFINTTDQNGNITYDSIRTNNLSYEINSINRGYNYFFYVVAYNGDSTLMAMSDQVNYLVTLPGEPKFNYIDYVSVDNDNNSVEINCLVDKDAIIDRYLIYRSFEDLNNFSEIGSVPFNNSSTINYMDYSANPDENFYQYQVFPVDTCNKILNAPSVYQSLNDTSYGQTIFLQTEINKDYGDDPQYFEQYTNTLNFNEYDKWLGEVVEYQLYRSVNREDFDVLPLYIFDRVNNPDEELKYIDIVTEFGDGNGRFCYYIKAIEGNNNPYGPVIEGSYSNISCVSQTPILFVPSSFTPNGDEHNEIFKPITNFVSEIGYEFSIYSRNGSQLFTTNDPQKGWDGTFLGKFVQNDNYVYHISYINGVGDLTEKVQVFTLIR